MSQMHLRWTMLMGQNYTENWLKYKNPIFCYFNKQKIMVKEVPLREQIQHACMVT